MTDESTPLLADREANGYAEEDVTGDCHKQFCMLVGMPPSDLPINSKNKKARKFYEDPNKLYSRVKSKHDNQALVHNVAAGLSNTLLLGQVILGAVLTALAASGSSHILITFFGVLNTVIAGLVAYLKSLGQPQRARTFRDELERIGEEIENAEVMWLGIQRGMHGYDEVDIEDKISVRSEVARLTALYDKAVKRNNQDSPDNAAGGVGAEGLRARPAGQATEAQASATGAGTDTAAAPAPAAAEPEEVSPATDQGNGHSHTHHKAVTSNSKNSNAQEASSNTTTSKTQFTSSFSIFDDEHQNSGRAQ